MVRLIVLLAVAGVSASPAIADDNAVRLGKAELEALAKGAQVTHVSSAGSVRRWTDEPDGTLVVSSDNKKYGNALGTKTATASGTWRVNDEGMYCVAIDWKRLAESWCAHVLRAADGGYYLNSVDQTRRIEFGK